MEGADGIGPGLFQAARDFEGPFALAGAGAGRLHLTHPALHVDRTRPPSRIPVHFATGTDGQATGRPVTLDQCPKRTRHNTLKVCGFSTPRIFSKATRSLKSSGPRHRTTARGFIRG